MTALGVFNARGAPSPNISCVFFEMPPRCNHRFSIAWVVGGIVHGVETGGSRADELGAKVRRVLLLGACRSGHGYVAQVPRV